MSDETQDLPEQTIEETTSVVEENDSSVHPGWDKMLAELPEAWHSKVKPYLQDNDRNVQSQMEKYTPFKEFIDSGVSADLIRGGLNLAQAIETNPTEVYSSLQDYLQSQGLLKEEAKQAAKDIMEEQSGDDFEDMFDGEKVPAALQREIDALKAQQEEASKYINEQEFTKETERYTVELESEMANLRQAHNVTEAHEIAIYDLMNAALNAGREITVADAARQLQQMVGSFSPAGAAEEAPMIVGSAGGAGLPAQDLSIPRDDKGKKEMLARMFEDYNKQR